MSTASPPDLTQYLTNMEALWRRDPKLAMMVDRVEDNALPALEDSKSGDPTLRQCSSDHRDIYLHSRYAPVDEAKRWAAKHITDSRFCYVVEGCGLGYHVRALADELLGDEVIVVIEPHLTMVRHALSLHDWSDLLNNGRLEIIVSADKMMVHQRLGNHSGPIMLGTQIAPHAPSVQVTPEFFSEIRPLITDFIRYTKTSMMTLIINGQTTCRNVLGNMSTYLAAPPINLIKGLFANTPAVIVSAGPSLRENVHLLKTCTDRVIIIATQTTLKPLLDRGIVPHFVCSLDFHELSKHYYEGIPNFDGIHLVAEPKAHPAVIDAFGGCVSLLRNDFAELCLSRGPVPMDGLRAGASVAHLAYYLAEYMGCSPIMLIGQDLALTNHVYYAPGTAIHDTWETETHRFCTMEMKEWEYIMRYKPLLRKTRDAQGRELYTEELMNNYLEQFEKDFSHTATPIINATEGGAVIRGTRAMPLKDALATHATAPINPAKFDYLQRQPWYDARKLRNGAAALQRHLDHMDAIATVCEDTMSTLDALKSQLHAPAEFNKTIAKVDRLRARIREYSETYELIRAGAQLAEFRKMSADFKLRASGAEGVDRARRQIERDEEFVRTLAEDTTRMRAILEEARQRFVHKRDQYDAESA